MNRQILLIAFAAAAMLAGCSKSEPQTTPETPTIPSADEIRAVASVLNVDADAQIGTKAAVNEVNGLKVLVLTSADKDDFTTLYAKGTMTFTGATESGYDATDFTGTKTLPTDNSSLYMVALHPHTGWVEDESDANLQCFTFNGTQDVLVCRNQYVVARGGTTVAAIVFEHPLTKIDIAVKAEDQAAIDAWGAIQKIEITKISNGTDFKDKVEVPLTDGSWGYGSSKSSSAPTVWPTYLASDGNTAFTGQSLVLTTTAAPAATTIMGDFSPMNVDTDLEISVTTKTASGSAVVTPIKVALPIGSVIGLQFTVNLNFKTKQIKGTATVTPWTTTTPIDKDVD